MSLLLCAVAFAATYLSGRRSLVAGLFATLVVGYFFGIIRANFPDTFSYFIFDAAAVGLFAAQLFRAPSPENRRRTQMLFAWVAVLIAWPILLLPLPVQDPMVQLVGLRSHVFLLPFLLLGARLYREDIDRLALGLAGLNVVAFTFAVLEFFLGVQRFYPRNAVTELIYRSRDAAGYGHVIMGFDFLRIPATFANSAAFAGTMVISLPFLLGAWSQKRTRRWHGWLLTAALGCSVLGVFMAASRTHFVVLVGLVLVSSLSGQFGRAGQIAWIGMVAAVAWIVSFDPRLQRFMSISPEAVVNRVSISVNDSFTSLALRYPLGNGLGGGGTSMPYFLEHLVRNKIGIENEYGRIMLEQGIPGLFLWICFLGWVFTRFATHPRDRWRVGRRLLWFACLAYFATGMIGVGLLTSIPFTVLLLLGAGWISVPVASREEVTEPAGGGIAVAPPTLPPWRHVPTR